MSVCPALPMNKTNVQPIRTGSDPSWAIGDQFFPRGRSVHDGPEVLDGSDPIEIGDLGSKVKATVTQYPFFVIILN